MDDLGRAARNLSVLSFSIIIYVLAGGYIPKNADLSLFSSSIKFENVFVLKLGVFIILIYYFIRFYIEASNKLNALEYWKKLAIGYPPMTSYIKRKTQELIDQTGNKISIEGQELDINSEEKIRAIVINKGEQQRSLVFLKGLLRPHCPTRLHFENDNKPYIIDTPLSRFIYTYYKFKALFLQSLRSRTIWKVYLPYLLFYLAFICWAYDFLDNYQTYISAYFQTQIELLINLAIQKTV